jgi:tetratricopeptide (TPR) repeat protein
MNILIIILMLNANVFIDNEAAKEYYNKGYNFFLNNDYEKAINYFNKTIKVSSDAFEVYYLRAISNDALGNYSDAINDYDKIVDVKYMKRHLIYNNRGLAYTKLNNVNGAIADFTKAIEIKPDFAMAYNNRAYQYEKNEDYKNALKDYYSAIEYDNSINSFDKQIYLYNAARLESVFGNKNYAIILIEEAIEINPNFDLAIELMKKLDSDFADFIKN